MPNTAIRKGGQVKVYVRKARFMLTDLILSIFNPVTRQRPDFGTSFVSFSLFVVVVAVTVVAVCAVEEKIDKNETFNYSKSFFSNRLKKKTNPEKFSFVFVQLLTHRWHSLLVLTTCALQVLGRSSAPSFGLLSGQSISQLQLKQQAENNMSTLIYCLGKPKHNMHLIHCQC